MDTLSLIGRLQSASLALREVQDLAAGLPEHRDQAVVMVAHLAMAQSYLVELGKCLVEGRDLYDAVLATAKGQTALL